MNIDEKKKVLYLIGMEQNSESIIKKLTSLQPNSLILPCYEIDIAPFGDLMRDIIIAVYQENVEEIFVTVSKDDRKYYREIFKEISENKGFQEKLHTLDYLFKNYMPEFPKISIKEWLEENTNSSSRMQNIVDIIQNHPLIPSNVKVTEYLIETENELELASL
ncbi:carbonic anhydrase [Neobacillus vireti]|uniref:carbonic anhydrase n=1 Tax=Neobacillus vireti TaxID=220686 RepID=UPI002FFF98DB